jgi:DNA topoisomerase-3
MAASKKYDITDTLKHAQKLYESGYITYPRAGCEYIPEGHFAEAGRVMDAIRAACPGLESMIAGADLNRKSAAWDNSRITEHHAIIPTTRVPLEGALSANEQKIYELVCARYVLQFLADCQYEETIIEFTGNGEVFRATGRTVISLGWQGWDRQNEQKNGEQDDEAADSQTLPFVRQGETGVIKPSVEERMTSPPKPYTYHGLIGSMNSIHTHVRDAEIRAKLKEIQGIGTEATQEGVIATLFERGYIEKKKQNIYSTSLGRHLIDILGGGRGAVLVECQSAVKIDPSSASKSDPPYAGPESSFAAWRYPRKRDLGSR